MQEFINKKGMKCRVYLSDTEYTYGVIEDVNVLGKTYTKCVDNYVNNTKQIYNEVNISIRFINKEFDFRDIDKFLSKNEKRDYYITYEFKGNPKIITRYIN